MKVSVATPKAYAPDPVVLEFAKGFGDSFEWTDDPVLGASGADVVYTDVWASMGQESEQQVREKAFAGFCVDQRVMSAANPGAIVLHCLPAHRGEEITDEVFEAHANEIFDEAENRLHAQKAVMATLMG